VEWLVQDVLLPSGDKAFPKCGLRDAVSSLVLSQQAGTEVEGGTVELVLNALRVLAPRCHMRFGDFVGQILWRHRRAEALQDSSHIRAVVDLTWMAPGDATGVTNIHQEVEETFMSLTSDHDFKLDVKQWNKEVRNKVMRLIQSDLSLKSRLKAADCDWLFYTEMHDGGVTTHTMNPYGFKLFLAQLADLMQVHPYQIFKAVGRSAEQ
jgi:hypothetical protein